MRPEIEAYLRANGAKYTTKALRQQLINAGHDVAEVDAALQETEATRAPQLAATGALRTRFWLWAIGFNLVGLVVATIWAFGSSSSDFAGAVPIVLGFFLLIGLGIAGLMGRSMLGRGLGIALVVPLLVMLMLTGTCMVMFGARATAA
jgi:hypothetical protein